jgi:hypothetical protein
MSSPIIKYLAAKSASYDNEPVQDALRFFNPSPAGEQKKTPDSVQPIWFAQPEQRERLLLGRKMAGVSTIMANGKWEPFTFATIPYDDDDSDKLVGHLGHGMEHACAVQIETKDITSNIIIITTKKEAVENKLVFHDEDLSKGIKWQAPGEKVADPSVEKTFKPDNLPIDWVNEKEAEDGSNYLVLSVFPKNLVVAWGDESIEGKISTNQVAEGLQSNFEALGATAYQALLHLHVQNKGRSLHTMQGFPPDTTFTDEFRANATTNVAYDIYTRPIVVTGGHNDTVALEKQVIEVEREEQFQFFLKAHREDALVIADAVGGSAEKASAGPTTMDLQLAAMQQLRAATTAASNIESNEKDTAKKATRTTNFYNILLGNTNNNTDSGQSEWDSAGALSTSFVEALSTNTLGDITAQLNNELKVAAKEMRDSGYTCFKDIKLPTFNRAFWTQLRARSWHTEMIRKASDVPANTLTIFNFSVDRSAGAAEKREREEENMNTAHMEDQLSYGDNNKTKVSTKPMVNFAIETPNDLKNLVGNLLVFFKWATTNQKSTGLAGSKPALWELFHDVITLISGTGDDWLVDMCTSHPWGPYALALKIQNTFAQAANLSFDATILASTAKKEPTTIEGHAGLETFMAALEGLISQIQTSKDMNNSDCFGSSPPSSWQQHAPSAFQRLYPPPPPTPRQSIFGRNSGNANTAGNGSGYHINSNSNGYSNGYSNSNGSGSGSGNSYRYSNGNSNSNGYRYSNGNSNNNGYSSSNSNGYNNSNFKRNYEYNAEGAGGQHPGKSARMSSPPVKTPEQIEKSLQMGIFALLEQGKKPDLRNIKPPRVTVGNQKKSICMGHATKGMACSWAAGAGDRPCAFHHIRSVHEATPEEQKELDAYVRSEPAIEWASNTQGRANRRPSGGVSFSEPPATVGSSEHAGPNGQKDGNKNEKS